MPKCLDVRIPQGLLEDLLPLAQERNLPIERYIVEQLLFVAQINRSRKAFWDEAFREESKSFADSELPCTCYYIDVGATDNPVCQAHGRRRKREFFT